MESQLSDEQPPVLAGPNKMGFDMQTLWTSGPSMDRFLTWKHPIQDAQKNNWTNSSLWHHHLFPCFLEKHLKYHHFYLEETIRKSEVFLKQCHKRCMDWWCLYKPYNWWKLRQVSHWAWFVCNVGITIINHPPIIITIFMGGINHQKWVVYYCYTHINL